MNWIERRHWSKQTRIEAGKRPSEERVRDFREIYFWRLPKSGEAGADIMAANRGQA